MKNKIFIIETYLGIIIFLFLISCKKDNENITYIEGNVSYFLSLGYVPNICVKLVKNNGLERFGRPYYEPYNSVYVVDTIKVNEQGFFKKNYSNLDKNGDYCLVILNDSIISEVYSIKVGTTNNLKMFIQKLGYLHISIRNIYKKYSGIIGELNNYLIQSGYQFDGDKVDTSILYRLIPGECKIINKFYINPYPVSTCSLTLKINALDTLKVEFKY